MKRTLLIVSVLLALSCSAQAQNLALRARATASESLEDMIPSKAIDGSMASRWSAIPGHNQGVWYQLDWPSPVTISEVVIRQFDRFVMELDVQVWDEGASDWRTVRHFGRNGVRLPMGVLCQMDSVKTSRLRIGNITNGPSFTEVEVYEKPSPPAVHVASDLKGNLIGIVSDRWGVAPVAGADVAVSGRSPLGAWSERLRSDEHGLFRAPMPLGVTGPLSVRAETASGRPSEPLTIDAATIQMGLTPRSVETAAVSLDGVWSFAPDPHDGFERPGFDDRTWKPIHVPAHWEMEGFRVRSGVGGYRRRFALPPGSGRLKLRFEGVYSGAEVWVNGRLVARHEGGATPFEADVTSICRPGENVLALRVREHTPTSDALDKMSLYADFPLAGIMRSVRLFRVPDAHVAAVDWTTTFDRTYRDAALAGRMTFANESGAPLSACSARVLLLNRDGSLAAAPARAGDFEISGWERAERSFTLPVRAPKKWDPEHPNLYRLVVELRSGGRLIQRLEQRAGFRQTEVKGPLLLVNGAPVKLRGTCHHDTHPTMGRAVTPALTRRDLTLMKEANLNALRTSHYPPIPELLDQADELGLFVEDEASFCWVGVSNDLAFTPRILQLTAELIARDRNHPSVFMWSLCNESEFGYGFERSYEWVRQEDPSRPTGAATSAWLEISTLHNPISIRRIDENEKLDKPLLFDESLCIFQGIFGDVAEMWVDPGIRDYYAAPMVAVYKKFMESRATRGSMIWCWADDIFCVPGRGLEYGRGTAQSHFVEPDYRMPGRGLVGDAPWGVVDGWRRQKPEFWITKKLHSPIKVEEKPLAVPAPGEPVRVAVRNEYDYTNLSEVSIAWSLGAENGTVRASVPSHTSGEIALPLPRAPKTGEALSLEFRDRVGRLVDAYRLPFGAPVPMMPKVVRAAPQPMELTHESLLAGDSVHILGGQFELAFDQGGGYLRRCAAFGEAVLLEMPSLHVLRADAPLNGLPDRTSWHLSKLEVKGGPQRQTVHIEGGYRDFEGAYDLEIMPDGNVIVRSDFRYTGEPFWAREVGMRLSVPRDCDVLEWDRNAEWSVYPPDHIGRPHGMALPSPASGRGAGGEGAVWSSITSPMGTNDFRSTKRNVNWAAIHYPGGPGVLVEGGGTKHVRAMMETDRISLHVNDWYGGTNVGWGEWITNYGRGQRIEKGARLQSTLRFQLVRFPQAVP